MDWFTTIGNMISFFPDTPALAVDMAMQGPNADHVGYGLAFGLQTTATPIDVYPPQEPSFADPAEV